MQEKQKENNQKLKFFFNCCIIVTRNKRANTGERKKEERYNMQTHIFHPLCLRLSNISILVLDRLGANH